ncbi:hypothetical protein KP509_01G031300 [Ceratopteris richardii]|nr:hypothetical protein KP509_01G031300 [Ceratopteris richardii]
MQSEGHFPNAVTYLCILRACGITHAFEKGSEIHLEIFRKGMRHDNILGTALLDMYGKCGNLTKAQEVFDKLSFHNVVSWTALVSGYEQNGHSEKAIVCFEKMQREGVCPNAITFTCILKACGSMKAIKKGVKIHDVIKKLGVLHGNNVLSTSLIDMYAKCGLVMKAQEVFDELQIRDIITWNALIAGYSDHGPYREAFKCLDRLKADRLIPDATTFACILKACGSLRALKSGQEIHYEVVRRDLLKENCVLGTALVDMYVKCGVIVKGKEVLDGLPVQDVASWNAIISAYCLDGCWEKAFDYYEQMRQEGVAPDIVTFASILKACGNTGAAEKGEEIHSEIVQGGFLDQGNVLAGSVIDMYARCGAFDKAHAVFDKLSTRDIVSWTALLAGYAHVGKHNTMFDLLKNMLKEGVEPNLVTFFVVLNACSYLGFVYEGQMLFEWISSHYGLIPTMEHQFCMVDLLSRAGQFEEAMKVIDELPSVDYLPSWLSLLGSCRLCGNVKVGKVAFDQAIRLDRKSAVAYICMRDIYAVSGMQKESDKIEALRVGNIHMANLG